MADLGNSKIKDTYTLVLQTDAGGNLQNLDGSSPNPFIINQNLRYLDGSTHPSGYVLISDGSGNASWGSVTFSGDVYISGGSIEGTTIELNASSGGTVSIPGLSWSSSTSGHISNSGLTGNVGIGTSTPNKPLTVVGDISGTTDLYLGSSTHTASTITAQEELIIKGNGLNDYIRLSNDSFQLFMDGSQELTMSPTETGFNASARAVDFSVYSEDSTALIRTRAEHNIVRLLDHVSINKPTGWVASNEKQQALAVSGTSVFYSGGTSHNSESIVAIGNISGTTNLYIDENMYSGTTNLLDIFASSGITNQDVYWSANTDGSISPSGLTTTVQTEGDLRVSGTVYTNTITTTATSTDTLTMQSDTIQIKSHGGSAEYLNIADDRFTFHFDGSESVAFYGNNHASPQYVFNAGGQDIDFKISGPTTSPVFHVTVSQNRIRIKDHLTIGANTAVSHADAVTWGLAVTGSSLFYSGGTTNTNTNAIQASGHISGATNLYIDQNTFIGGALHVSGDTYHEGTFSATGSITTSENLYASGDTYYEGQLSGTGNITTTENLYVSGNTFYEGALSGTGNVTAIGGFVGDLTGNADTVTNGVYTSNNLSVMAATTSAQLAGVISNETGTGLLVFGTDPVLTTPNIGTPSAGNLGSCTAYPGDSSLVTVGTVTTGIWESDRKFVVSTADVGNFQGDIVYFGGGSTVPGIIYYFDGTGWASTDANALLTSSGLTAVALAEEASGGMLIRGMVTIASSPGGSDGNVIYLSEVAGKVITTPPTTASSIVRAMGYAIDTSTNKIWFNPDNTWVELSS